MTMKEEDKELLLRDLCARLPYGVMLHIESEITIDSKFNAISLPPFNHPCEADLCDGICGLNWEHIQLVQPYLRPMSSMTEEEYEQYRKFSYYGAAGYRNNDYKEMVATPSFEKMDFLNAHHFDYRGLIEKGLALEAPKGMYNIKEK